MLRWASLRCQLLAHSDQMTVLDASLLFAIFFLIKASIPVENEFISNVLSGSFCGRCGDPASDDGGSFDIIREAGSK